MWVNVLRAVALVLVAAGCGARSAPDLPAAPAAVTATETSSAAPDLSSSGDAADAPEPSAPQSVAPSGQAAPQATAPGSSHVAHNTVTVGVSKSCMSVGEAQEVTIASGRPRSGLSMAVAYSDYRSHGIGGFGDADDHGNYVWHFVVPPDAPPGQAVVMVGATGPDKAAEGSGTGQASFAVAGPGGCVQGGG